MKVLLSKEHYCYQIHRFFWLNILLQLSANSRALKSKLTFFIWELFQLSCWASIIGSYNTRGALKKLVSVPPSKTTFYGIHSITAKSVRDWNTFQNKIAYEFYQDTVVTPKLVSTLKAYLLTSYLNNNEYYLVNIYTKFELSTHIVYLH